RVGKFSRSGHLIFPHAWPKALTSGLVADRAIGGCSASFSIPSLPRRNPPAPKPKAGHAPPANLGSALISDQTNDAPNNEGRPDEKPYEHRTPELLWFFVSG